MKRILLAISCVSLLAVSARAQWFNFSTIAGSAGQGSVNGTGANAQFYNPGGVAMDWSNNIYVADTGNDVIRKITPNGSVSTFAGSPGVAGSSDGANALFNSPQALAVDSSGNVYVADTGNFTIRKITPAGVVSTLAGSAGVAGSTDGQSTNAEFFEPEGIALDGSGNLYVADTWNHTIREITSAGAVTTLAGLAGNFGSSNGVGSSAQFYEPQGITVAPSGNIFVADTGNNTIRQITPVGAVTTLAGSAGNFGSTDANGPSASFDSPAGISADASGNLYVADSLNNTIRIVTPAGQVTTIAGTAGNFGSADGTNGSAQFWGAQGIAVNPTNSSFICIADTGNSIVRQLTASGASWVSGTFAGTASMGSQNASGSSAQFFWPMSAAVDSSGNVYVADSANNTIRKITPAGAVSIIAGSPGISGSSNGPTANALFNSPQAVAVDAAGNIFVSDTGNSTIREITGGNVSTIAGSPGNFGSADGTGTAAQFYEPEGIAVDSSDDVFVADTLNHTIREITSAGLVTTLAGTAGNAGSSDGTSGVAQFNRPTGMAIDSARNLYVTDLFNHTIRKITPTGAVTTLAGLARIFGNTDATNSAARFFEPEGIAVSGGNVYVADSGNYSVRQLTSSGTNWVVSTVAGWPGISGSANGSGITARFCYPAGLAVNAGGYLFVADSGNNTIRTGSMFTNNPPVISPQPQSQMVTAGNPVTFSVGATGSAMFYYQWQFNGANILGATASSYYVTNAQPVNGGNYSVTVSSSTGSILSSNATLIVLAPPSITNQPVSQTCLQGSTVTFTVVAGPSPLTYQWLKNGVPMANSANASGVTTATLTISSVTTADNASYSVLINNGYGSVSSSPASLTAFVVPPADSIQPYGWWLLNEGTGSLAFDYSGNGHTGTLNAGATWTSGGHSGNGVYFNATSPALITLSKAFRYTANNWTATMWVNRWESRSVSTLISGNSDALKLEQVSTSSHVGYTLYSKYDCSVNYTTPLNSWVHLAFVETSAGISLYVNGVLQTSNTTNSPIDASGIGCFDTSVYSDYLDATLDDVRIYTNALTQPQLANLVAYGRITPIPAVTLTAPTNNATFTVSSNIVLTANVVNNGQTVSGVQFYSGTTLLGQSSTAPYQWSWTNAPMGYYLVTAQAVFNGSSTASSSAVGVNVVTATNSAQMAVTMVNGSLQLSWPPDHTGWILQAQTNAPGAGLGTNWVNITGSTTTNQMIVPETPTTGSVFYRLSHP